jgi:hypothetical protein
MTPRDPAALLAEGRTILDPLLEPFGYEFRLVRTGSSSGGDFAVGRYETGERGIELHVRHALGIVKYIVSDRVLRHQDFMKCLGEEASYPGFSDDPMDAFRHLGHDFEGPLRGFIGGTGDAALHECADRLAKDPGAFKRSLP